MLGGSTPEQIKSRAARVLNDPAFCARLVEAYISGRPAYPAPTCIEARIYEGFPSPRDEAQTRVFHDTAWPDRYRIVETLEDECLRWFGRRLVYYENRSFLPASALPEIERHLLDRLFEENVVSLLSDTHSMRLIGLAWKRLARRSSFLSTDSTS